MFSAQIQLTRFFFLDGWAMVHRSGDFDDFGMSRYLSASVSVNEITQLRLHAHDAGSAHMPFRHLAFLSVGSPQHKDRAIFFDRLTDYGSWAPCYLIQDYSLYCDILVEMH